MKLIVCIEKNGEFTEIGTICGADYSDAQFCYSEQYISGSDACPISLSLPIQREPFSAVQTRNYFEGLLPEGFTRRNVAGYLHVNENDYLEILKSLGKECIGAIKVFEENEAFEADSYEELSPDEIKNLAREGAAASSELVLDSHLSLAGASGKVGLLYHDGKWFLPKGSAPSNYIVKQSHVRLNNIVVNEQLCQSAARKLGIDVPESMIINTGNANDDEVLFASKRFDRTESGSNRKIGTIDVPLRLHQEDFAQALGIASLNKYEKTPEEHYLKRMFDLLRRFSSNPIEDSQKLWDLLIVNYLFGNTDCHMKNVSLIYSPDLTGLRLAPCYDIVSTAVYGGNFTSMSVSIGGKYDINKISADDFENEASMLNMGKKHAMDRFYELRENAEAAISLAADEMIGSGIVNTATIRDKLIDRAASGRL